MIRPNRQQCWGVGPIGESNVREVDVVEIIDSRVLEFCEQPIKLM